MKQQNNRFKMHDGRESLAKSSMSSTSNQITLTVYMAAKTGKRKINPANPANQSSKPNIYLATTEFIKVVSRTSLTTLYCC